VEVRITHAPVATTSLPCVKSILKSLLPNALWLADFLFDVAIYDEKGAEVARFSSEAKAAEYLPANAPSYWFAPQFTLPKARASIALCGICGIRPRLPFPTGTSANCWSTRNTHWPITPYPASRRHSNLAAPWSCPARTQ
jgi:hypothetical protein